MKVLKHHHLLSKGRLGESRPQEPTCDPDMVLRLGKTTRVICHRASCMSCQVPMRARVLVSFELSPAHLHFHLPPKRVLQRLTQVFVVIHVAFSSVSNRDEAHFRVAKNRDGRPGLARKSRLEEMINSSTGIFIT